MKKVIIVISIALFFLLQASAEPLPIKARYQRIKKLQSYADRIEALLLHKTKIQEMDSSVSVKNERGTTSIAKVVVVGNEALAFVCNLTFETGESNLSSTDELLLQYSFNKFAGKKIKRISILGHTDLEKANDTANYSRSSLCDICNTEKLKKNTNGCLAAQRACKVKNIYKQIFITNNDYASLVDKIENNYHTDFSLGCCNKMLKGSIDDLLNPYLPVLSDLWKERRQEIYAKKPPQELVLDMKNLTSNQIEMVRADPRIQHLIDEDNKNLKKSYRKKFEVFRSVVVICYFENTGIVAEQ